MAGRIVRAWVVLLLLAMLIGIVSAPASAGPEPPTFLSTAYNTQRKLVRTPDGTVFAAITVNASGVPQVRVLSSSDGLAWSTLPPPSTSGNWSDRSAIAIDSRGRLHLAWTEPAAIDRQVFYSMFDGTAWSPMEQLSHSPGYAGFPSIAVDAVDRTHVVWYGFDGAFYQVYYRARTAGTWSEERALTNEAVDATNPAIALSLGGTVHIAWFRENRAGTYTEIAYLRTNGETIQESTVLSTAGVPSFDPTLVVDAAGSVHVAWTALVNGTPRIEGIHRTASWSSVESISASPGGEHASLALDGASRLHIAWEGVDGQIYLQMREGTWSAPVPLTTTGLNRYPSLRWSQHFNPLCGSNSKLDLVWTEEAAGVTRLAYRTVDAIVLCANPPSGPDWATIGIGSVTAAAISLAVFAVWLRRRWYPKPPNTP